MKKPSRIIVGGLAAILSVVTAVKSLADVIIRTELPETTLIADGTTIYNLNVRGNTMQHLGTRFNASEWDVVIPDYITVVGAQIPDPAHPNGPSTDPNDFFFPQLPQFDGMMESGWNRVDQGHYPFVGGGELVDNVRTTQNVFTGPADLNDKLLGKYFFTVNSGTSPRIGNFDLNDVYFMDTNFSGYYSPDGGSGVQVQNDIYTIVAPQIPGDMSGNGSVGMEDVQPFVNALLYNPSDTRADMNGDGTANGRDIQGFVNALISG